MRRGELSFAEYMVVAPRPTFYLPLGWQVDVANADGALKTFREGTIEEVAGNAWCRAFRIAKRRNDFRFLVHIDKTVCEGRIPITKDVLKEKMRCECGGWKSAMES